MGSLLPATVAQVKVTLGTATAGLAGLAVEIGGGPLLLACWPTGREGRLVGTAVVPVRRKWARAPFRHAFISSKYSLLSVVFSDSITLSNVFMTVEPISSLAEAFAARFLSSSNKASISGGYSCATLVGAQPAGWLSRTVIPGIEAGAGGSCGAFAAFALWGSSVPLGVLAVGVRFAIGTAIFRAATRADSGVAFAETTFSTAIFGAVVAFWELSAPPVAQRESFRPF